MPTAGCMQHAYVCIHTLDHLSMPCMHAAYTGLSSIDNGQSIIYASCKLSINFICIVNAIKFRQCLIVVAASSGFFCGQLLRCRRKNGRCRQSLDTIRASGWCLQWINNGSIYYQWNLLQKFLVDGRWCYGGVTFLNRLRRVLVCGNQFQPELFITIIDTSR